MKSSLRHDVQGLRALAVAAVILCHVTGWPRGGFAGVDVFFVVSGFLITGLLLREADDTGRVSLGAFALRRLKRIAPASLLVIAATLAAAWFLFNQARFASTLADGVSAVLLVSNWRFALEGTDYFASEAAVSPLQHLWSLSVEEQFYLVLPLVVLAVVALTAPVRDARGRRRARGVALGAVVGMLVAASFGFALWQSASAPTVAYFSTLTRVWELGAGALLAVVAPAVAWVFGRVGTAGRAVVGWAGFAGVVASFVLLDETVPFPGPWALAPVLATLAVLAAGIGASAHRYLLPIANPVTTAVGTLSYSLYLWHFPVLVFLVMLLPAGTQTTLIVLGVTVVVSVLGYLLVEQPLHRMPVGPSRVRLDRGDAAERWVAWRERFGAQVMLSGAALVVVVIASTVVVQLALKGEGPLQLASPAQAVPASGAGSGAGGAAPAPAENPEVALQAELWAAASATAWPTDLSPSLDAAIAETSSRNPAAGCFDVGSTPDASACTWGSGDAPHRLVLVGDSTALAYAPAFRRIADDSGGQWRVTAVGLYGCRFTTVDVQNDGAGVTEACPQRKADVAAMVRDLQPDLVVVSNAFALGTSTARQPLGVGDLVSATLAETAQYGLPGRVVYLAPPPLGADLGTCYSPVKSPQDCNAGIDQTWYDFESATEAAVAAAGTGDHVVGSLGFSCAEGYCPAFAGTVPTKYDSVHITPEYAERIASSIRWELVQQGLMQ
ncbi:acyltransferase [Herbiconiux moechotypicola]|uniref:SGNH hydrolase domain-containing protein n=1 Tax=Herbiconiux moechotypicola TaxID=637393 RepID=A0ABN3DNP6_9MICO|nr:acyltransferase family protein [Herbiconiux moechotypicola]MCS5730390.1 acyltransferase [Herbiconiux moechotypicola]